MSLVWSVSVSGDSSVATKQGGTPPKKIQMFAGKGCISKGKFSKHFRPSFFRGQVSLGGVISYGSDRSITIDIYRRISWGMPKPCSSGKIITIIVPRDLCLPSVSTVTMLGQDPI